jgi:hypothetical protein
MSRQIFRYEFSREIAIEDVQSSLVLAQMAAEGLHGPIDVILDAAFFVDQEEHLCLIDASNPIGRDFSRIFAGFLTREFSADQYFVELLEGDIPQQAA